MDAVKSYMKELSKGKNMEILKVKELKNGDYQLTLYATKEEIDLMYERGMIRLEEKCKKKK